MRQRRIAVGVDESGTGSWAGPFFVVAVAARDTELLRHAPGLRDSKKLTDDKRRALIEGIRSAAVVVVSREVSVDEIRSEGTKGSWRIGVLDVIRRTVDALEERSYQRFGIIVDGPGDKMTVRALATMDGKVRDKVRFVVRADDTEPTCMAAGIVAKTLRNNRMVALAQEWPEYGWERNSGYGTPEHQRAIREHGLTPHHRPIKRVADAFVRKDRRT